MYIRMLCMFANCFNVYMMPFSGYGVIAKKSFGKGDFILEYAGDLITREESTERKMKYARRSAHNKYSRCYLFHFMHRELSWW